MQLLATLLSQYKNTMYFEGSKGDLSTGDVVKLTSDDFKNVLRYPSIQSVLEQYLLDPNYVTGHWVILNQPCDIVHDVKKNRKMKNSLFLAPLQGLKAALRKGIPAGDVLHYISAPDIGKTFEKAYQSYLVDFSKKENPALADEKPPEYNKRIHSDFVHPIISDVLKIIEPVKHLTDHPDDLLDSLIESSTDNEKLNLSLTSFKQSTFWQEALSKFDQNMEKIAERSKVIILKSKSAEDVMAKLCLNQLDSQGVFFFEPNEKLSSVETDLAFVIKLDDLLTLKIEKKKLDNGDLYNLLLKNRVLSLTENFSDRLLNIMGTYFSKIGTDDVMSGKVLDLYNQIYPDMFFLTDEKYEEYSRKTHSQSKL